MITFSPFRVTMIQAAVLLLLALVAWIVLGTVIAYSVFLGGLISTIPNACFARMVFRQAGARAIENVVRNAFRGELIKLALSGVGFGLCFALVEPISVLSVFLGFILIHVAGLAGLITLLHSDQNALKQ